MTRHRPNRQKTSPNIRAYTTCHAVRILAPADLESIFPFWKNLQPVAMAHKDGNKTNNLRRAIRSHAVMKIIGKCQHDQQAYFIGKLPNDTMSPPMVTGRCYRGPWYMGKQNTKDLGKHDGECRFKYETNEIPKHLRILPCNKNKSCYLRLMIGTQPKLQKLDDTLDMNRTYKTPGRKHCKAHSSVVEQKRKFPRGQTRWAVLAETQTNRAPVSHQTAQSTKRPTQQRVTTQPWLRANTWCAE